MANDSFGLNETALNSIITNIDNYENNIRRILNNIADTYVYLSKCTTYNSKQSYALKAKLIRANIKVTNINLENYKADLRKVKNLYRNTTLNVARELRKAAQNKNIGREYRN